MIYYPSLDASGTVHDRTPLTMRTTNKTGKSEFDSSLLTDNLMAFSFTEIAWVEFMWYISSIPRLTVPVYRSPSVAFIILLSLRCPKEKHFKQSVANKATKKSKKTGLGIFFRFLMSLSTPKIHVYRLLLWMTKRWASRIPTTKRRGLLCP